MMLQYGAGLKGIFQCHTCLLELMPGMAITVLVKLASLPLIWSILSTRLVLLPARSCRLRCNCKTNRPSVKNIFTVVIFNMPYFLPKLDSIVSIVFFEKTIYFLLYFNMWGFCAFPSLALCTENKYPSITLVMNVNDILRMEFYSQLIFNAKTHRQDLFLY